MAEAIHTCRNDLIRNEPRTVRRTVQPALLNHCYASSNVMFVRENANRNMFTASKIHVQTSNSGTADPSQYVRFVQPSEWATLDMCCVPFYRSLFGSGDDVRIAEVDIEFSRIVTDRRKVLMDECSVRARLNGT